MFWPVFQTPPAASWDLKNPPSTLNAAKASGLYSRFVSADLWIQQLLDANKWRWIILRNGNKIYSAVASKCFWRFTLSRQHTFKILHLVFALMQTHVKRKLRDAPPPTALTVGLRCYYCHAGTDDISCLFNEIIMFVVILNLLTLNNICVFALPKACVSFFKTTDTSEGLGVALWWRPGPGDAPQPPACLPGGWLTSGWPPRAETALDWCVLPASLTLGELLWAFPLTPPSFLSSKNKGLFTSGEGECWTCAEDVVMGHWGRSLCGPAASLSAVFERLKGTDKVLRSWCQSGGCCFHTWCSR